LRRRPTASTLFPYTTLFRSKVGRPGWTGADAGAAVRSFLNAALLRAQGPRPDVQPWYAFFLEQVALPNARLFAYLVAYGELLVRSEEHTSELQSRENLVCRL